jgi:hypothetical protein
MLAIVVNHSYGIRTGGHGGQWTQMLCTQDAAYGGWPDAGNAFYEPWTQSDGKVVHQPSKGECCDTAPELIGLGPGVSQQLLSGDPAYTGMISSARQITRIPFKGNRFA